LSQYPIHCHVHILHQEGIMELIPAGVEEGGSIVTVGNTPLGQNPGKNLRHVKLLFRLAYEIRIGLREFPAEILC